MLAIAPLKAEDQVSNWEAAWEKELSPFYGLSLADSLELAKNRLSLKVIMAVKVLPEDEAQKLTAEEQIQQFYSLYFQSQRFRPYTAMLILPNQKLPGAFKDRALEKDNLLIINTDTTKESFLHLVLHLVTEKKESQDMAQRIQSLRKEKASENTAREIRELQLKILCLDSETEKDLFILSKQKEFALPEADKTTLFLRIERNIQRLETELKVHLSDKESSKEPLEKARKKIETLKAHLAKAKS